MARFSKSKTSSSSKPTKAKSQTASEETTSTESQTTETVKAPVIVESAMPIPTINTAEKLMKECLHEKAHTCVLAFVPESENDKTKDAS